MLIVCCGLAFFISLAPGFVGAILGILAAALIFAAPVAVIIAIVIAFSSPKQ